MTEQEAVKKGNEKVEQLRSLAEKLMIAVSAENTIVRNIIKPTVIFTDMEEYDIDKPKMSPNPHSVPQGNNVHVSKLLREDENTNTDLPK